MSYAALEASANGGFPIELYEFNRGMSYWHFTSHDMPVTYNGYVYAPITITSSEIQYTTELNKNSVSITTVRDNPVAMLFAAYPPGDVVTAKIWRFHGGDGEFRLKWLGRILSCEWKSLEAILHTESIFTSIRRTAIRAYTQRSCSRVLYGSEDGLGCNLNRESYRLNTTVSSISGAMVVLPGADAHGDRWYDGGFLTWVSGVTGAMDSRIILSQSGTTLQLAAQVPGMGVGDTVAIYPGCDHTMATCYTKFNNLNNFGGTPFMPIKNPFGGTTLW